MSIMTGQTDGQTHHDRVTSVEIGGIAIGVRGVATGGGVYRYIYPPKIRLSKLFME